VRYPFHKDHPQYDIAKRQMKRGGNIITIQVKGGIAGGKKFMNGVKMCSRSSNLGDSRTIVTQPAISTHSKLSAADRLAVNITDGLVRISVGLEHPDDIIQDLKQALDHLK
jgi:O-succinylhomoserine sulfhydrylase